MVMRTGLLQREGARGGPGSATVITVLKFILSRRRLSTISPFCTAPPSVRVRFRDFGMKGFHRCHPSKSTKTAHTSFGLAWMSTENGPAEYLKQLMLSFAGGSFGKCCQGLPARSVQGVNTPCLVRERRLKS